MGVRQVSIQATVLHFQKSARFVVQVLWKRRRSTREGLGEVTTPNVIIQVLSVLLIRISPFFICQVAAQLDVESARNAN